ncbi:MAG: 16S rRNA (adenine(1518)-N(6)/adenine(1519)-N(6))-dimethyltransferase RsmA [Ignavibacteriales bacterium]|nr:16S rRNA (adenine(1518)-N(6)/adenine(1519)-N(6))-dimethyltransferase RsmA [Ignavibacteriales bacterium]
MERVRPLKKFGQNYLVDQNIVAKIVEEISPQNNEAIIEIGPGLGVLTKELYRRNKNLYAVEIDNRVIEQLKELYPELNLINQDFLKLDLHSIHNNSNQKLRVVGNIPYNLTSPIVFKLIENSSIINDAVFMVQYEVAKRMTAQKGTKDYGIFCIVLNYFSEIKFCFKVSPNVFYPKPKIFSAVVHIYFKPGLSDFKFDKLFIKVVKACFGNRRKTLKNSLNNSIFGKLNFENSGIDLSLRAEQLDQKDFIVLTKFVQEKTLTKEETN